MATREIIQCDNERCKSVKKESNNWVRAWRYDFGILVTQFEAEPPQTFTSKLKSVADACGSGCAIEIVSKWLDENVRNGG